MEPPRCIHLYPWRKCCKGLRCWKTEVTLLPTPLHEMQRSSQQEDNYTEKKQSTASSMDKYTPRNNDGLSCGWLCFYPRVLQRVNRPECFLVCICVLVAAQGMIVTGISGTVVTSLEKRFGFKSAEVALLGSSYDTAYGVFAILIGFVGTAHKPRYLGIGALLMAVASFAATLPHYLADSYEAGVDRDTDYCLSTNSTLGYGNDSRSCNKSKSLYLVLFCAAYALLGIGAVPIYTLAPAHIDRITRRGQNGLQLGIMYGCAAVGPAIGFALGKPFLSTYVDIKQPENSNLDPSDPGWIGAWWIGYLVGCAIFLAITPPLLALPREFPGTQKIARDKEQLSDTVREPASSTMTLRTIWLWTKSLLTNWPFLALTAATTCEGFAVGGLSTFSAKFIESQFGKTASAASLLTGGVIVVGASLGIFLGGFLVSYFKWNCRQTIRAATIIAFFAFLLTGSFLIGCAEGDIAGVNSRYYNQSLSSRGALNADCHRNCNCSMDYFKPLCIVKSSQMYFSPCHAGCRHSNTVGLGFQNCSCFPPDVGKVVDGLCPRKNCNLLVPFLLCELLLMFLTFMNNVPTINATLRVVPESQGSFAMGFQQVFIRFLAFVPAPIVLGKLFDLACTLWQADPCSGNDRINCLAYDNSQVRNSIFAVAGISKLLSFVFLLVGLQCYRLPSGSHTVVIQENEGKELEPIESTADTSCSLCD